MSKDKNQNEPKGFLKKVEKIGNALPHPSMIFVILCAIIIVISHFAAKYGAPVTYFDAKAGEEITTQAVSLLTRDGIYFMFNDMVSNFTGFAPLGVVLVTMLGVGVAEWTGLIETSLKKLLAGANPKILTALIVFAGVISNIASDAGYVVVIPLGAILFAEAGRHPIAGLAAAFAGVSAGFSANLVIGATDPMLSGITNEALTSAQMNYQIAPTANWFFMFASTFLIVILGTLVTHNIVEKNLGEYKGTYTKDDSSITDLENKGLRNAGIVLLIMLAISALLMFPENALFKSLDQYGDFNLNGFLSKGFIGLIFLLFLFPAIAYGKTTGKIKTTDDLAKAFASGMTSMAGFLVLAFFAAQFVSYFNYTNLGTILSVRGAELLQRLNFTGLPLVVAFVLLSAFLNLFMGSASAKWAIMAPVFIPMMAKVGLSPELTQAAYRIGDSTTNIISPLMNYFAMVVVFAKRYDEDSGIGTIISTMLPYSMIFLLGWIALLVVWFVFNIPLGPGAPIHMPMM